MKLVDDLKELEALLGRTGHPSCIAKAKLIRKEVERLESLGADLPTGYSAGPWVYGLGYAVRQTEEAAIRTGRDPMLTHTIAHVHCDAPCPPVAEIAANAELIARLPDLVSEVLLLRAEVQRLNTENGYLLRDLRRHPDPDY